MSEVKPETPTPEETPKTDDQVLNEQIDKVEEVVPEKTAEQAKIELLERENQSFKDELEFMMYIYNTLVENMYDNLDEYSHKVKKSRMKYIVRNKDAIMEEIRQSKTTS